MRVDLFGFSKKSQQRKMNGGDMSETKDQVINLFGKMIPLLESQIPANPGEKFDAGCQILDKSELMDACCEITKTEAYPHAEDCEMPDKSSALEDDKEDHETPTKVNHAQVNPKPKEDQAETNGTGQEKILKKPDKVIPCPRCNSLDTKFCYFNNYNVNQPRHFCKNCQRYWTAGGTMRNVPVGAGRRKNKHLVSQYRQVMVSSDGVPASRVETPDSAIPQLLSCGDSSTSFRPSTVNGTVLNFGHEAPLCESMATVLHLKDQKRCVEMGSVNCGENGGEPSSCGSSMTASTFREHELPENGTKKELSGLPRSCNEITPPQPLHCYPNPPWVLPWNPGWTNVASMAASQCSSEMVYIPDSSNPNPVQWCSTPMLAIPGFCPPSIPLPFVPASYWGCMPVWAAGTGNMTFAGSNGCLSPSSSPSNSCCSGNSSPTLGKHSRDANLIDEEKSDKCIVVPKTLRIDDPDEAAKSSIWATLGIKPDQKEIASKGGIFKSFESKAEGKGHVSDAAQFLEANPAALSRSQTFQEST